ncbi:hypothetical protein Ae201684P_006017 [Aphanomyces euteiches]|uniref:Conserved oligomeric Golgi complex subunit 2 n=1 Tax=Aphanomyces euteiches TaxID=100861 RepID=A0A6G0WWD2_9STRA|nr:hypothetical protein Ae201684_011097 [Aphanomyces euteiches]KAH9058676.1 hypothetical protein Ae201684P_006017 [Aphanomyces euteiches]
MYCFDASAFDAAEFNATLFLEECQGRNPIAQVHRDLELFMQSLENQMVAIIDKDYAEFLQLSIKLKGVNSSVLSLRTPLSQILERVQAVKESAYILVSKAENQVAELERIQRQKEELQMSISISERLHLVEGLLGLSHEEAEDKSENDTLDEHEGSLLASILAPTEQSILLERAARIVLELQYRIAQAADIPHILAEEPRMALIERTLRERLEAEFATEIVPDNFYAREHVMNATNVDHLLRAYLLLQHPSIPEEMIARLVVQPFLDETMTRGRLDGGHRGSCEGLSSIYSSILSFVERTLGAVLRLSVCQSSISVDILGQSIWKPIHDTMRSKLAEVFTPANPDRFYHTYTTSMSFISSLEQFCTTKASLARFRATVKPFHDGWNVAIYFQLRQNELNQAITTSLGKRPTEDILVRDVAGFAFPVSTQTLNMAVKCWADGTYIASLLPQFARFLLHLLSTYCEYWHDPLGRALLAAKAMTKTSFEDVNHPCLTSCDDVYCLGSDLHRFIHEVNGQVMPAVTARVSVALPDEDAATFVSQLLEDHIKALEAMELQCWDAAIFLVAEECKKVLPALRSIKGQYQMTNKPLPTTASMYVPTIARPLHEFLDKWGACLGSFATTLSTQVLLSNVDMYASLAFELLKSATELEESLRSRKTQRAMVSSALDDTVSDTDKMRRQLWLDMQELARISSTLTVDIAAFPSFQRLHAEVSPKEN